MERDRINLSLTSEALDVIYASATERKRGEWVSNAIVSYAFWVSKVSLYDWGEGYRL